MIRKHFHVRYNLGQTVTKPLTVTEDKYRSLLGRLINNCYVGGQLNKIDWIIFHILITIYGLFSSKHTYWLISTPNLYIFFLWLQATTLFLISRLQKKIQWWIVVCSILVGLLFLILVGVLLWKVRRTHKTVGWAILKLSFCLKL